MQGDMIDTGIKSAPLAAEGCAYHNLLQTNCSANHTRCLVVDDDRIILKLVSRMLAALGYQTETAEKKPALISMLATGPYALAVLDLVMPDMNGYEMALKIKNDGLAARVIIMTGAQQKDCEGMMATGFVDGWLFKPFKLNELRHMLEGFSRAA